MEDEANGSVEVIIRLQPPEVEHLVCLSPTTLSCLGRAYAFDSILSHEVSQEEVFKKVGMKLIASAKKGYNSCVFAYGQTGSGKTYTMSGAHGCDGLVQRCMKELWETLQDSESFELRLCYYEIYNEQIRDLLQKNKAQIKIKESITLGFYLQNLEEVKIESLNDLLFSLERGMKSRTTAETKMNRESSRSHSILTISTTIREKRPFSQTFCIKSSKMHFVDLAGSEKQKSTMAAGDRLKEASSINKSLTSLSIVIEKLSNKATHIPYRDSVITKILRDSLGGNSRTVLIATLSSSESSIPETVSTINFAAKAKKVCLSAKVNEEFDGSVANMRIRIKQLEEQIKKLNVVVDCQECISIRAELEQSRGQNTQISKRLVTCQEEVQVLQGELTEKQKLLMKYDMETESSRRKIDNLMANNSHSTSQRVRQLQRQLEQKNKQIQQLTNKQRPSKGYANLFDKFKESLHNGSREEWKRTLCEVQFKKMGEIKKELQEKQKMWLTQRLQLENKIESLQRMLDEKEEISPSKMSRMEYSQSNTACFGFPMSMSQISFSQLQEERDKFQIMEIRYQRDLQKEQNIITGLQEKLETAEELSTFWQQKYERANQDKQEALAQLQALKSQSNHFTHQLSYESQRLARDYQKQKAQHLKAMLELQTEIRSLKQERELTKSQERARNDEISELRRQNEESLRNLKAVKKDSEQLQRVLKMKDIKLDRLYDENNKLHDKYGMLMDQERKGNIELRELKAINEELTKSYTELKKRTEKIKTDFLNDQTKSMMEKQSVSTEFLQLKEKVSKYQIKINELVRENSQMEARIADLLKAAKQASGEAPRKNRRLTDIFGSESTKKQPTQDIDMRGPRDDSNQKY